VKRNTEALIEQLRAEVLSAADDSLAQSGVRPQQALADLERLGELIQTRRPEDGNELAAMYLRYSSAAPPQPEHKASIAYRLRLLFLDRWNLWSRLTRYRTVCANMNETTLLGELGYNVSRDMR
jgi:hypothetical protein